jgi:hypothetical protein
MVPTTSIKGLGFTYEFNSVFKYCPNPIEVSNEKGSWVRLLGNARDDVVPNATDGTSVACEVKPQDDPGKF